jgi:hypothetical protein
MFLGGRWRSWLQGSYVMFCMYLLPVTLSICFWRSYVNTFDGCMKKCWNWSILNILRVTLDFPNDVDFWLFTVLRPAQEYFTCMEKSPFPVEGFKILAYARRPGLLSREGSLSCHTYCDTGPRFFRSHPKDCPIQSPLTTLMGTRKTYFNLDPHGVTLVHKLLSQETFVLRRGLGDMSSDRWRNWIL